MPAIFPSEWRNELLLLQDDLDDSGIIAKYIDTIEEYEAALKNVKKY